MTLVRILGSLTFAIILISTTALILIVSTLLESVYGTPFVQRFFYQAGWFDVFLGLLAANILCSALLRFPYKKRHTGFIITHIGILALLSGALLSRLLGVDGQMMLYEGDTQDHILKNTYELVVHKSGGGVAAFDLASHPGRAKRELQTLDERTKLVVSRVWEDAVETTDIKDGPDGSPPNHAIKVSLASKRVGFNDSFWLVEKNPLEPHSARLSMGPATIELKKKTAPKEGALQSPASPAIHILKKDSGDTFSIDLTSIPAREIPLGKTGFKISDLRYYPDARVENNKLVSVSEEPLNPAVEFYIDDAQGGRTRYTRFALFPEFEAMHGRNTEEFPLAIEFISPASADHGAATGPSLTFYPGNPWTYESKSSKSETTGELAAGQSYPTGWMDFSFQVKKILDHAVVSSQVEQAPAGSKGLMAIEISVVQDGKPLSKEWVLASKPQTLETPSGKVIVALREKTALVPFMLSLKDFRKVDYPGTNRPASYESDVVLHDHKENTTIEKTIRMNKPLDYKGYRIFQSSFVQDPSAGEASVFTVAKNPGITLIYSGACVLFTGVFMVFFVPPLSSIKSQGERK